MTLESQIADALTGRFGIVIGNWCGYGDKPNLMAAAPVALETLLGKGMNGDPKETRAQRASASYPTDHFDNPLALNPLHQLQAELSADARCPRENRRRPARARRLSRTEPPMSFGISVKDLVAGYGPTVVLDGITLDAPAG